MTTIVTYVGSPGTIGAAGGGRVYAFNALTTAPQQIVGSNPARQKITVYNPGAVDVYIAPTLVQNTGADVPLTPSVSALGGCFIVYKNGGCISISGECQKPWQAFSASGTANPLTVIDSNV